MTNLHTRSWTTAFFLLMPLAVSLVSAAKAEESNRIGGRSTQNFVPDYRLLFLDIKFKIESLFHDAKSDNGLKAVYERQKEYFLHQQCSCTFTLQTDGSIGDVSMFQTSESRVVDDEAIALLKRGAPYFVNPKTPKLPLPVKCVIHFPSALVRTYAQEASPIQGIP